MGVKNLRNHFFLGGFFLVFVLGCGTKFLSYDKFKDFSKNSDFEKKVAIEVAESPEDSSKELELGDSSIPQTPPPTTTTLPKSAKKKSSKKIIEAGKVEAPLNTRRQPEIESDIGFSGRRPLVDPFRVGERVKHEVSYMGVKAGELEIEVKPFVKVNQQKSYNFRIGIKTTGLFSSVYSVDDHVTTYVNFDDLTPTVYELFVKESGKLGETKTLFDWKQNKATFWEKVYTKKDGEKESQKEWDILPFSQNVFSVVYYLRNFTWDVGSENKFRIAHDGKNLVFEGKAIRKEKIETDAGTFDTIVIQPVVSFGGKLEPTGDNFIWITDDDRKFIVRIESKIKIGSLVSEVVEIKRGH